MNLKEKWKDLDYFIVIPYIILCVIGVIMVFSASSNIGMQNGGSATGYLIRQLIFVAIGIVIVGTVYNIRIRILRNQNFLSYLMIAFILTFAFLKFFGTAINGSPGWISLGFISIQPAEFVKVYFILLFANRLSNDEHHPQIFASWKAFRQAHAKIIFFSAIILGIILWLPDLGGMLISFTIIVMMIFASGISYKRSIRILTLLFGFAFFILYLFAFGPLKESGFLKSNYMMQRIVGFADPFVHSNGIGQQLVNSYYAISNGGLFGKGIGNSIQKTGYLPEPNTDFIMAIISEELGIVGVLIIMALLFFIIARIMLVGIRSNSTYHSLICYGIATYLVVQTYFNVGGVVGLLPITGVTFPFISYGGSSMMTLCICLGLVLNISRSQKLHKENNISIAEESENAN